MVFVTRREAYLRSVPNWRSSARGEHDLGLNGVSGMALLYVHGVVSFSKMNIHVRALIDS